MQRGVFSRTFLGLGLILSFAPTRVWADFLIQFVDNTRVAVHRYVEEGQAIKIYTPQGAISFRKEDIARITEIDTNHSMIMPLETISAVVSPSGQGSTLAAVNKPEMPGTAKGTGEMISPEGNTAVKAAHLNTAYQDVEQEIKELLAKHSQDMELGASEEVLAENRQRLNELNSELHKLIDDMRQTVPEDLPAWAQ